MHKKRGCTHNVQEYRSTGPTSVYVRLSPCQPVHKYIGRGGALVESMTFNRRVVDSTPALAAT